MFSAGTLGSRYVGKVACAGLQKIHQRKLNISGKVCSQLTPSSSQLSDSLAFLSLPIHYHSNGFTSQNPSLIGH